MPKLVRCIAGLLNRAVRKIERSELYNASWKGRRIEGEIKSQKKEPRGHDIVNGARTSGIHAPASIPVIYSAKNSKRKDDSRWRK